MTGQNTLYTVQINMYSHMTYGDLLTVRRCFLRMYKMKLHILDVTPRKVRIPSKHCRVFNMLTVDEQRNGES